MGLDQSAVARKGEPRKVPQTWTTTDADGNEEEVVEYYNEWDDTIELAYWRKHPNLQGWMQELYYEKGGEGEFNCVDLELTLEYCPVCGAVVDEREDKCSQCEYDKVWEDEDDEA
jgi:hypothetical protein